MTSLEKATELVRVYSYDSQTLIEEIAAAIDAASIVQGVNLWKYPAGDSEALSVVRQKIARGDYSRTDIFIPVREDIA